MRRDYHAATAASKAERKSRRPNKKQRTGEPEAAQISSLVDKALSKKLDSLCDKASKESEADEKFEQKVIGALENLAAKSSSSAQGGVKFDNQALASILRRAKNN